MDRKQLLGWVLTIAVGIGIGVGILVVMSYVGSTTTTVHVSCGSGFTDGSDPQAPGATRTNLTVRDGEPFHVPLPEGIRGPVQYHVKAHGNVTLLREDAPYPRPAGVLGGCASWPGGAPASLGPFIPEGDGVVEAWVWPSA